MPDDLVKTIANMKEKESIDLAKEMLEKGEDPLKILEFCREAVEMVGKRFETGEYFLPELIAQGKFNPEDLYFGFEIARCYKPVEVFDQMLKAAQYAQKRLGGEILNSQLKPLQVRVEREFIKETIEILNYAGLPPGEDHTLEIF